MEKNSDDALYAGSFLVLCAVILFLLGWSADKFATISGQVIGVVGIFFFGWGALTFKNPDKFGGVAIKIVESMQKAAAHNAGQKPSNKSETNINIGTMKGDLNQNINSDGAKINTGKKKKS